MAARSVTEECKVILNSWERKMLRTAHGAVTEKAVWRIRSNQKLRILRKTPDLVSGIKPLKAD
jgi:hypothetical protein